jgi:hypothetical protein
MGRCLAPRAGPLFRATMTVSQWPFKLQEMHVHVPGANSPRAVTNVAGKALGGNSHLTRSYADLPATNLDYGARLRKEHPWKVALNQQN